MTHDVSQNGWQVVHGDLRTWTIPGQSRDVAIPLLPGAPGFVLAHWMLWFDRDIEDIEATVGDDHGWAYRQIAGTDEWSNHASATAVDINSTKHPYGARDTFTTAQRDEMVDALAGKYRGVIRAGFAFRTTPDDMHFELVAGRIVVRELAGDLFNTPRGVLLRNANPWMMWMP